MQSFCPCKVALSLQSFFFRVFSTMMRELMKQAYKGNVTLILGIEQGVAS